MPADPSFAVELRDEYVGEKRLCKAATATWRVVVQQFFCVLLSQHGCTAPVVHWYGCVNFFAVLAVGKSQGEELFWKRCILFGFRFADWLFCQLGLYLTAFFISGFYFSLPRCNSRPLLWRITWELKKTSTTKWHGSVSVTAPCCGWPRWGGVSLCAGSQPYEGWLRYPGQLRHRVPSAWHSPELVNSARKRGRLAGAGCPGSVLSGSDSRSRVALGCATWRVAGPLRCSFRECSGVLGFSWDLYLQIHHRCAFPGVQIVSREFQMP